jgi:hypothetical protein
MKVQTCEFGQTAEKKEGKKWEKGHGNEKKEKNFTYLSRHTKFC